MKIVQVRITVKLLILNVRRAHIMYVRTNSVLHYMTLIIITRNVMIFENYIFTIITFFFSIKNRRYFFVLSTRADAV